MEISGIKYINNAFGYPNETKITKKKWNVFTKLIKRLKINEKSQ